MIKLSLETTSIDRGASRILKEIEKVGSGVSVDSGVLLPQAAQVPTTPGLQRNIPVAVYAKWHEEGIPGLFPQRSFLGSTVTRRADEYARKTSMLLRKLYSGSIDLSGILEVQGKVTKRWIQIQIRQLKTPPNTPKTRRLKRRLGVGTNPLIFTGTLLNSISSRPNYSRSKYRSLTRGLMDIEKQFLKGVR
jgi:hypothetical protein